MILDLFKTELDLYRTLFEKSPFGALVIDEQGVLVWLNSLAQEYLGKKVDVGDIMLPSKDWPDFRHLLAADNSFYYLIEEQGFIIGPQVLDSERKRTLIRMLPSDSMDFDLAGMQRDLIQQRKLANLGRMMLEMAHELNNPLAGISMGTQLVAMSLKKIRRLLQEESPNKTKITEMLDKIEEEIEKITQSTGRAAGLRHELLAYSKPNQLNLRPYQTNKLIDTALKSFEQQPVFRHMTIHKEFVEHSPTILCDASKMEQILYNLVKNAHEATRGKGEVWIREVIPPEKNAVIIEVEDDGPGIAPDMLDKIFSPFLTTKPRTGTGLGLSISKQIIEQHGGTFSVYNKPQSGACFHITFPYLQEAPMNPSLSV
jgi:signal transduction histidine kinase